MGAMKSATSTLHKQLACQAGIFMSEPKEPNFFSDDDVYGRGLDWYEGLFRPGATAQLRGESSTHYTKLPTHPRACGRMAELLPAPKLIYNMRHPVQRLISHYTHEWTQNVIDLPIDRALDRHPELIDYGRYHYQLQPYVERFGKAAILPLFLPRLKKDPQGELQRVCDFIGYSGQPRWQQELPSQNTSAERLRDRGLLSALLVDNPVGTRLRQRLVPQSVRDAIKVRLGFQLAETPQLSAASLARVEDAFDRDLALLGPELGADLRCGNFDQVTAQRSLTWV